MTLKKFAMAAVLVLMAAWPLSAQQPKQELVVTAQNLTAREMATNGKARKDSVAAPGDVIEYQLVFANTKTFALKNVVFQDPIPGGLVYVPETAKSTRDDVVVEYSVDKGATWSVKPMVEVVEAGKKVSKPATPEQYTNVRWRVTGLVAPGATVEARFQTRVNGALPKPAAATVKH